MNQKYLWYVRSIDQSITSILRLGVWTSDGGIMVSMVAFQAVDPGSIPGLLIAILFFHYFSNSYSINLISCTFLKRNSKKKIFFS